ncbi:hypothetical protein FI667_g16464, partial [Globisporangium splendens]
MTQQKTNERVTERFFVLTQSTRRSIRSVIAQQRRCYILHLLHVIERELFVSLLDAVALEEDIAKGNGTAEGSSDEEITPKMMMRSWPPDEIGRFVRACFNEAVFDRFLKLSDGFTTKTIHATAAKRLSLENTVEFISEYSQSEAQAKKKWFSLSLKEQQRIANVRYQHSTKFDFISADAYSAVWRILTQKQVITVVEDRFMWRRDDVVQLLQVWEETVGVVSHFINISQDEIESCIHKKFYSFRQGARTHSVVRQMQYLTLVHKGISDYERDSINEKCPTGEFKTPQTRDWF